MMSKQPQPKQENDFYPPWQHAWHSDDTQPLIVRATAPIPSLQASQHLPIAPNVLQETRGQRFQRGTRRFFKAVLRRIDQLIGLTLVILLLLLLARFALHFFVITTSVFTSWVSQITDPLVYPFNNLVAPVSYNGFSIDITTLIAAGVWLVAILLVRRFIHILFGK